MKNCTTATEEMKKRLNFMFTMLLLAILQLIQKQFEWLGNNEGKIIDVEKVKQEIRDLETAHTEFLAQRKSLKQEIQLTKQKLKQFRNKYKSEILKVEKLKPKAQRYCKTQGLLLSTPPTQLNNQTHPPAPLKPLETSYSQYHLALQQSHTSFQQFKNTEANLMQLQQQYQNLISNHGTRDPRIIAPEFNQKIQHLQNDLKFIGNTQVINFTSERSRIENFLKSTSFSQPFWLGVWQSICNELYSKPLNPPLSDVDVEILIPEIHKFAHSGLNQLNIFKALIHNNPPHDEAEATDLSPVNDSRHPTIDLESVDDDVIGSIITAWFSRYARYGVRHAIPLIIDNRKSMVRFSDEESLDLLDKKLNSAETQPRSPKKRHRKSLPSPESNSNFTPEMEAHYRETVLQFFQNNIPQLATEICHALNQELADTVFFKNHPRDLLLPETTSTLNRLVQLLELELKLGFSRLKSSRRFQDMIRFALGGLDSDRNVRKITLAIYQKALRQTIHDALK